MNDKNVLTPIQKTYRYMQKLDSVDGIINRKQEQIDSLRSLAMSTAVDNDSERVQSSGSKDKIGECISKVADLCAEINADIDTFIDVKADIMHTIDKLESLDERNVLYYRYFQHYEFRKISQEMHISESTVYRLHREAMQVICGMLFSTS